MLTIKAIEDTKYNTDAITACQNLSKTRKLATLMTLTDQDPSPLRVRLVRLLWRYVFVHRYSDPCQLLPFSESTITDD